MAALRPSVAFTTSQPPTFVAFMNLVAVLQMTSNPDDGEDALGLEGLGHLGHGLGEVLPGQNTLKAVARSRGNAGGDGHVAPGAGPHWAAGDAGMRCIIMSIIICIMAMCSVII